MIRFEYSCDGCGATAISGHVRQRFESVSGRCHGFGRYVIDSNPERDAPDGWIAFDVIGCTYCSKCWDDIQSAIRALRDTQEPPA